MQPIAAGEHLAVDEYRRRAALGELGGSSSFELLEGVVVGRLRQSLKHEAALEKLQDALRVVPEGWQIRVQKPLELGNSQPEPDIAVVQKVLDDYASGLPRAEATALVIEAADASLLTDRRLKGRIYSRRDFELLGIEPARQSTRSTHQCKWTGGNAGLSRAAHLSN